MDHSPSARERDPEQTTDTVGHSCRHCSKEQLPEPRGEYVPTRDERNCSADQKEGESTHQWTYDDCASSSSCYTIFCHST